MNNINTQSGNRENTTSQTTEINPLANVNLPNWRSANLPLTKTTPMNSRNRLIVAAFSCLASLMASSALATGGKQNQGCGKDRSCTKEAQARESSKENSCRERNDRPSNNNPAEKGTAGDKVKDMAKKQGTKQTVKVITEAVIKGAGKKAALAVDLLWPTDTVSAEEEKRQLEQFRRDQEKKKDPPQAPSKPQARQRDRERLDKGK